MEGAKVTVNGQRHHYRQTYNALRKSKLFNGSGISAKNRVITVPLVERSEVMFTVLEETLKAMDISFDIEKY